MIPLLDYIENKTTDNSYDIFSSSFKKYLLISCVSLLEKIMSFQIRNTINSQGIDTSSLELNKTYTQMLKKYPDITQGEHVVVQNDFTNAHNINTIATYVLRQDIHFNELGIDFFKYSHFLLFPIRPA